MLGDQADKSKNPLKTALRRRKAKGVTFAEPTYHNYSDDDYDTEEEEDGEEQDYVQHQQAHEQHKQEEVHHSEQEAAQSRQQEPQQAQRNVQQSQQSSHEDTARQEQDGASAQVAPLRPRAQAADSNGSAESGSNASVTDSTAAAAAAKLAAGRVSEDAFETNGVDGPKRSKDGTVRDSFFNDPVSETKKITLTPGLLRDDGTARPSNESRELRQRQSLEKLEREPVVAKDDKKKPKEKKEKDKKSGGFRSIFSRKDKKSREDDNDSVGKQSSADMSELHDRDMDDFPVDEQNSPERVTAGPTRAGSKLQKPQPRVEPSPTRKGSAMPRDQGPGMDLSAFLNESRVNDVSNVPPSTMRVVGGDATGKPSAQRNLSLRSAAGQKPRHTVQAKRRMDLEVSDDDEDDEDVEDESRQTAAPQSKVEQQPQEQEQQQPYQPAPTRQAPRPERPHIPGAFPDSYLSSASQATIQASQTPTAQSQTQQEPEHQPAEERLSDSPVQVSPVTPAAHQVPALDRDVSSQDEEQSSPVSSPSPELVERQDTATTTHSQHRNQDSITTSTTSATTTSTWNDTSLRAFFDSGTDIRDLLAVVYDKSDVEPAGADHPIVGTLFKEQNAKLAEITTQLDNMLGDYLARKQRMRGTI